HSCYFSLPSISPLSSSPSSLPVPILFFSLLTRPPPISTLFPYTTLFRSCSPRSAGGLQPLQQGVVLLPQLHGQPAAEPGEVLGEDRKSTRLNSSHGSISYAVFCLKKKKKIDITHINRQQTDL